MMHHTDHLSRIYHLMDEVEEAAASPRNRIGIQGDSKYGRYEWDVRQ
jgi:hypothetical protein